MLRIFQQSPLRYAVTDKYDIQILLFFSCHITTDCHTEQQAYNFSDIFHNSFFSYLLQR